MQGRDYLVIDVEATCDDRGAVPREEMEIIEIGAVYVEGRTYAITAEFQTFIRPVRHPTLTPFCTALTSITQAHVDPAPGFVEAITALRTFIDTHRARARPPLFSSWGGYDRNQFRQDATFHKIELPFGGEHLNIKRAFTETLKTRKHFGMSGALKRLDIPLDGTHHRGIDDARNIAKILPYAIAARPMPPPPKAWRG